MRGLARVYVRRDVRRGISLTDEIVALDELERGKIQRPSIELAAPTDLELRRRDRLQLQREQRSRRCIAGIRCDRRPKELALRRRTKSRVVRRVNVHVI